MSAQFKPVCCQHRVQMRVVENGYRVRRQASFGPYDIHAGDVWECPIGGERIVSGWSAGPLAQHFEEDFAAQPFDLDLIDERRVLG